MKSMLPYLCVPYRDEVQGKMGRVCGCLVGGSRSKRFYWRLNFWKEVRFEGARGILVTFYVLLISRVLRRSINNARLYKKNKKTPASQQYCMFYNRFGKNFLP